MGCRGHERPGTATLVVVVAVVLIRRRRVLVVIVVVQDAGRRRQGDWMRRIFKQGSSMSRLEERRCRAVPRNGGRYSDIVHINISRWQQGGTAGWWFLWHNMVLRRRTVARVTFHGFHRVHLV